jgi:hypothetical protein
MGRIAGVPNKLTSEVKEKLQTLVEGVVDTLDIAEMTIDQKLKLLQITSQFILPRLKAVSNDASRQEDIPIFIDICEKDWETGEVKVKKSIESHIPANY